MGDTYNTKSNQATTAPYTAISPRVEILEIDVSPGIRQYSLELEDPDTQDTELSGGFDVTAYQLPAGELEAMLDERERRLTNFHGL